MAGARSVAPRAPPRRPVSETMPLANSLHFEAAPDKGPWRRSDLSTVSQSLPRRRRGKMLGATSAAFRNEAQTAAAATFEFLMQRGRGDVERRGKTGKAALACARAKAEAAAREKNPLLAR